MILQMDKQAEEILLEILDVFIKTKGMAGMGVVTTLMSNAKVIPQDIIDKAKAENEAKMKAQSITPVIPEMKIVTKDDIHKPAPKDALLENDLSEDLKEKE